MFVVIKFPAPGKTTFIKFPPSRAGKDVKCPGYARGGGGCLSFDLTDTLLSIIDHFTVICLVAWPLNESEVGVDVVLMEPPCFSYVNDAILMLISSNWNKKSSEVSIKTRSPPASFKGQAN